MPEAPERWPQRQQRGGAECAAMPGGKENAPPGTAEKKEEKKKKAGEKDEHDEDDDIGPGDEKKGIAEIGWRLPCACTVLGGIHSTPRDPPCSTDRQLR